MEFQLPTNLQSELISYDPVLKALAREQRPASTRSKSKSKHPLGNPIDLLVPEDILSAKQVQHAIDRINQSLAPDRFSTFVRTVDERLETYAIIYHFESVWIAAWIPPEDRKKEYVYGYTYCFKDTASSRKMIDYQIKNEIESYKTTEIGRSVYLSKTELITEEAIRSVKGKDTRLWSHGCLCGYIKKGRRIAEAVKAFEEVLKTRIISWKDSISMFDRIKNSGNINELLCERMGTDFVKEYWEVYKQDFGLVREEWTPSVSSIFHYADYVAKTENGRWNSYYEISCVKKILDTPFFRKWIQANCDLILERFADEKTEYRMDIKRPWLMIQELSKAIACVHHVWGDAVPIDFYQTNLDVLLGIKTWSVRDNVKQWLAENMTPASYFQVMSKFYKESMESMEEMEKSEPYRTRWNRNDNLQIYQFSFDSWRDTCSMLNTILEAGKTIEPPKRWRIAEFHDHVQAEAWKIKNPNHSLPQDLFPAPVKVQVDGQTWSFFQPIDTHQLAQWGQAVRNCVGNATNYAEGVRKKQHFIVLCLVEGKPTFTVQLQVRNGMLTVDQIAGFANAHLKQSEREQYTQAFAQALQEQEKRLKSGSAAS